MISLLMGCGRDIFYTKTWNPTHNGDQLSKLHKDVNPTKEKPLIIAMNEIDIILNEGAKKARKTANEVMKRVRKKLGYS